MAKVTIDGKEYDSEKLSEDARNNILNVQFCEKRMKELQREIAMAQTARNTYAAALKGALPKDA